MLGLQTALALVTVLTHLFSSGWFDRNQPRPARKSEQNGIAPAQPFVQMDTTTSRIRRGVARTVTAGSVPAQRNRRGSAVCPEGSNYQARYKPVYRNRAEP